MPRALTKKLPTKKRPPRTAAQKAAQFKKGNKGRVKGVPNKFTRDLKEAIIDAAVAVGGDGRGKEGLLGYLKTLARKHPKQYTGLLSRVMPLQITGDIGGFIGQVNVVPVPMDRYLTSDEAKRLNAPNDIVDAEFTEAPNKDEEAA